MHVCIMVPMDPTQAIETLKRAGLTEKAIAESVGVNQSTVNRIGNGSHPSYSVGRALIELAQSVLEADKAELKARAS